MLELILIALIIVNSLTNGEFNYAFFVIIIFQYFFKSHPKPTQVIVDVPLHIENLSTVSSSVEINLGGGSFGPLTGSCSVQPCP